MENYDHAEGGRINKIYVVVCNQCETKLSLVALNKTHAANGFALQEWQTFRNYGNNLWWYCPKCAKERGS